MLIYSVSAKPLLLNLDLINSFNSLDQSSKVEIGTFSFFRPFYNKFIYGFTQLEDVISVRNVRNFSKSSTFLHNIMSGPTK